VQVHKEFEWDAPKADSNFKKHKVSFGVAARVLRDDCAGEFHIETVDEEHSDEEERWITTASHPADRQLILRIVWTMRPPSVTRIISARPVTPIERRNYEEEISFRQIGKDEGE
jgi:uncharacterized DUF497 family protein